MRRQTLAAVILALASAAFGQTVQPLRYLLPLARYGHFAGNDPKRMAENLKNHAKFLQGSVEELGRFIKTEPGLEEKNRKTLEGIVAACKEEAQLIDEDAAKVAALGEAESAAWANSGGAADAADREAKQVRGNSLLKQGQQPIPAEPRFE